MLVRMWRSWNPYASRWWGRRNVKWCSHCGKQYGSCSKTKNKTTGDFPGCAAVKNPPANAGDMGSSPGLGRSHMPQSN